MEQLKKPPLGIMPKYIWDDRRLTEIENAVIRFFEAQRAIPLEWVIEWNELTRKKQEETKC